MKKSIDKLLLVNHVRHANAHNKIKEEQEMWKARETELAANSSSASMRKHSPLVRGRLVSDSMDSPDRSYSPSSTYWSRQLMKVEENDPYRWGHSGYKEMYPEEFISTSDSESSSPGVHLKKRKRKQSVSSDASSSKKKKKVKRKHKHSHVSHKSKHKQKKKKAK